MNWHIPLFLVCLGVLGACREQVPAQEKENPVLSFPELREGDIVFRLGRGLISRAVQVADGRRGYSHIGIVVLDKESWKVVHAVPGEPDFEGDPDRVKMDELSVFFSSERAEHGALMRLKRDSSQIASRAAHRASGLYHRGVEFDHSYDAKDTSRMYCTELVNYVYCLSGVDLGQGRYRDFPFPGKKRKVLFPGDVAAHEALQLIYNY